MRICVLGAGLAGLASAYHLVLDGHEVVILDSAETVGTGTSRANGGQLSYSYVAPLAAPGVPRKSLAWLLDAEAPLRLKPQTDPRLWRWLLAFARACRRDIFEAGTRDMLALAYHSRAVLAGMMARDPMEFCYRENGKLVVFRAEADLAGAASLVAFQAQHGAKQQVLDREACLALEPALREAGDDIVGGVFTPDEAVGDAFRFCAALQGVLQAMPKVGFRLGERVAGFALSGSRITAAQASGGAVEADAFVLAAGVGAVPLAEGLGLRLPIYPLKGYSLTAPVGPQHQPPQVSITDAAHKVVYALLQDGAGSRLRAAGMVDLAGFGTELVEQRVALLQRQAGAGFPHAADWAGSERWAGLRPATPDWKPVLGQAGPDNLWLNTGLGGLGFTICCGTGQLLASLIAGRPTEIPVATYGLLRPPMAMAA